MVIINVAWTWIWLCSLTLKCWVKLESPGILACLDGYMNIAMEQTEEYVNGQLKNKYGDAFIRGNNVLYISTSKRTLAEGA
ncbi:Sm-like protein LSM36B [Vitis vinifera]|uniref:Sm-like protein LSM36B n=1 Tax=Vitis vinifera TaxID=29760 RepID=A0A438BT16_VITVI|nr:Sm-like protein LSM36B [Vitis vinifera]